jgi:hypothetical protein
MKEDKRKVRRIVYEIGMRFNNFIIVDKADTLKTDFGRTYTRWKCLCDCGKEFLGTTKSIKKGKKSCGCLSIENQYKKLPAEIVMINIKYGHYISCAKRRNLDWNLNIEQFTDIVKNSCYYCGSIGSIKLKRYEFSILVNGIDRMDNNIGGLRRRDTIQGHYHELSGNNQPLMTLPGASSSIGTGAFTVDYNSHISAPITDGTNGTPRTAKTTQSASLGAYLYMWAGSYNP